MVGTLLLRGMLVGVLSAILCFGFLKIVGEPPVERAIAFESAMEQAKDQAKHDEAAAKNMSMPTHEEEPELVSRATQAGLGLLTGVGVYNVAFGGLFALAFALAYGRMGGFGARATSALLAASGWIAVYVVPNLKYPANPPSVGEPDTIGARTALYFALIAISLAAMIAAWMLRNRLVARTGEWNAGLIAGAGYVRCHGRGGVGASHRQRSARDVPGGGVVAIPDRLAWRAIADVGNAWPGLRRLGGIRGARADQR